MYGIKGATAIRIESILVVIRLGVGGEVGDGEEKIKGDDRLMWLWIFQEV